MLKILAVLALLYFFLKSVGHVVRLVFGSNVQQRSQQKGYTRNRQQQRTTREGLHVDSMPSQEKQKKDFKGGDYVDYEEVD